MFVVFIITFPPKHVYATKKTAQYVQSLVEILCEKISSQKQ